jgi:LacI family transcriptional regulator
MRSNSSPTIKDVAREAGVSMATVSKVINDLPVGKASREKVEEAIDKLGYQANTYARALKSSKTYSVALVLPSLKHPFFAHLTDELTKSLMRNGYRALLMITNYDPKAEEKCFAMARGNKTDGVIALTYNPDLKVGGNIPVVSIDRHLGDNIPCISSDNYRGGELAAKKLIELGCRNLLHLRSSSGIPGETDKRTAGFEFKCAEKGADYRTLVISDQETETPFYRFLEEHICGERQEFDGIFCSSDIIANHIRHFLENNGIRAPEQVQIIGYDGIPDRFTDRLVCSTIEQPIAQMAEAAVETLLNLNKYSAGANICLPVRYLSGGTTKD